MGAAIRSNPLCDSSRMLKKASCSLPSMRERPLQPTGFAETDEKVSVDNDHADEREGIPEGRIKFRHVVEIHPVDSSYQGRYGNQRRIGAQAFGDFIFLN